MLEGILVIPCYNRKMSNGSLIYRTTVYKILIAIISQLKFIEALATNVLANIHQSDYLPNPAIIINHPLPNSVNS